MPPDETEVTHEEVDQSRVELDDMRRQVEDAKVELAASEASRGNAMQKAQFDAEKERLQRELDAIRAAHEVSVSPVNEDASIKQLQGEPTGVQAMSSAVTAVEDPAKPDQPPTAVSTSTSTPSGATPPVPVVPGVPTALASPPGSTSTPAPGGNA